MTANQEKIIQLLRKHRRITAAALAQELKVSDRSIRNYIAQICTEYPDAVHSDRHGYHLNKPELFSAGYEYQDIPQSMEERTVFLLNLLISTDENVPLNIFDISEEIYVSASTVRNDLKKIRALVSPYDLKLVLHGDSFYLQGTEKKRRQLISSLVEKESRIGFINLTFLQQYYRDIDVFFIKDTILSIFNSHEYFINDYSLNSLITHVLIAIDRIKKGNIFNACAQNIPQTDFKEYVLAQEISHTLSEHFQLTYNGNEIYDLALLIKSRTSAFDYQKIEYTDIENFVGERCCKLVNFLIKEIHARYAIHLEQPEFFVRFALHIHNLLIRAENHSFTKNPLVDEIKKTYPLIFDISVTTASLIRQETGILLNTDEIAYLAFHLGSAVELQEKFLTAVNAVLYCPRYYDMGIKLAANIEKALNGQILITNIITNEEDLLKISQIDLILSTISIFENIYSAAEVITIHMLSLTEKDIAALKSFTEDFHQKKAQKNFYDLLCGITCSELFDSSGSFCTKTECLDYMCNVLFEKGYVNHDFHVGILEREALSSTALGNFAIPHALKMNADKTGIYIMILRKPLLWDEHEVSIILMMCFNQNDRKIFNEIFDKIAAIFIVPAKVDQLLTCKTYNEFIAMMAQLL